MDNLLLKAKHWQVFIFLVAIYFISTYCKDNSLASVAVFSILLVGYIGWYALLGNSLYMYLPKKIECNSTWFLVDAFLLIAFYGTIMILFDGNLQVNGVVAIPFFYLFFAIAHLFWFPAVLLISIESGSRPVFSQYAGTMLQLFFWPIGIWFIQPRINKIYNAIQANTLDYPRP
ncbi:hypothetical protein FNT36_22650 [Hymenobacter setariae]|uniref:Uncharacterized protein n=1 Tax=Hymenobacter setariae TaxID=2594794 RepID=A0A558BN69_9BACT|nr:hypothetical protein [Hymenobacter setariae]TVT37956.1 hypothetical protein FNT36_22650 [Hymenobacter setariae]